MKKVPSETPNALAKQENAKIVYTKDKGLDLPSIFEMTVGTKIQFNLDEETLSGTIKNVTIKPNESIIVQGIFSEEDKSGFVFAAVAQNQTVGGALIFPEKSTSYVLAYNSDKDMFTLIKRKLEVRKIP